MKPLLKLAYIAGVGVIMAAALVLSLVATAVIFAEVTEYITHKWGN